MQPVSRIRTPEAPELRDTLRGPEDPEECLDMVKQKKQTSEAAVREIRRRTRRKFSPEEKIRIVLEGLRGEQSVAELCRREGIAANLYYRWSKDFLEAGKKQLAGDTVREATSDEVKELRNENRELKEVVAEITLKNRVLKKSLTGHGEEDAS
jgi:transposase